MSLSFFITLSLLSSQAFLSKKLFPSPYEITHVLQKNSLKESDQKLVNFLLKKDQKINDFNPELIYEMINKNSNYQDVLQDIKTNYQQVSNKEITKTKSKSSSSKKIFESFGKWQTSFNFNKPYSMYYFAKQYLEKDTKLSQNEIDSLKNDLASNNNALYLEKTTNFWNNNKKIGNQFVDDKAFSLNHYDQWIDDVTQEIENDRLSSNNLEKLRSLKGYEKKKLTNFLASNNEELKKIYHKWIKTNDTKQQLYSKIKTLDPSSVPPKIFNDKKAWDLIDFLINNKNEKLYSDWKNQLSIDLKKMLLKYSEMFKKESVIDFIKNSPDFSFQKLQGIYIEHGYYNQWVRWWRQSNKDDYDNKKLKWIYIFNRHKHIDNIWRELIKNKDFFQKLFDKFFDEFRKLKSNKELIQENWKKSEKYRQEKAKDAQYDNKPKYQTDLDEWINTIKNKPIDRSKWFPNDMWIFGPFMEFYIKEFYYVRSHPSQLHYRIQLIDSTFIDIKLLDTLHQGDLSDQDIFHWIISQRKNPHPSVISFIFNRSRILEDFHLRVHYWGPRLGFNKLNDFKINPILKKWEKIKNNDINTNLLISSLLKDKKSTTLNSIIENFQSFAKQQNYQIKSNQEYLSEASKQWFIEVIAKWLKNYEQFSSSLPQIIKELFQDHIKAKIDNDENLKKIDNDWTTSSYKTKSLELNDIKSLLNQDKNQAKASKEAIKHIKNHFKDFVKNKLSLDNDLREYLASNFIKDIILLNINKDLQTKHFITKWYKKNKKVDDLKLNYQKYLEKA